ncbi:MAG TPA: DNA repair protein RecO [Candidatus Binataceae bacterium]|nr:DNA repair protein RecO [Candidatus Binataceae bacterium]
MPAEESSPAIVLRTRDYSESDRIVTLLTRHAGKLGGIAKGAKQSRRRFERKLEVFSHVMVYFRRRPHGELVFITKAEAGDLPPFDLTDDIGKIALGSYMVELADALNREEADSTGAYRIVADSLGAVARCGASRALRQAFELNLLRWAGYQLEFRRCQVCGRTPAENATSFVFIPSHGGIVCHHCREGVAGIFIGLGALSVAALAQLGSIPVEQAAQAECAGRDAEAALARFMTTVLDRKLRSVEFLHRFL